MATAKAAEVKKPADDLDSLVNPENRAKTPWAKWEKVGRQYAGVLVERKIAPNALKSPTATQQVYTLADAKVKDEGGTWEPIEGGLLKMSGRRGEPAILQGLDHYQLGTIVVVKLDKIEKSKQAGYHDAKYVNVYTKHTINQEVLDGFLGMPETDGGLEKMPF
jgi:hypothetical protein